MKHEVFMNILWHLPRSMAHKILYRKRMNKKLDLKNPKDFNEKIQWLIVNEYGKREAELADKNLVKEYVRNLKIENLFIPKTYKIYSNANEIKLNELPEKFVLKSNNGSGDVFICTSKDKFYNNINKVRTILNKNISSNFAKMHLEYQYSYIKPCIIAEEYLNDKIHKNPLDYKFYCFNGKVSSVLVCSNREDGLKFDDFDLEWNDLDYTFLENKSNQKIEKPKKLQQMIKIAEELSKDIPFVRIDLYEINEKIYFGEYTFSPAAGLISHYKEEALIKLGNLLDIDLYK